MGCDTAPISEGGPPFDEGLRGWLGDYIAAHPHHTTAALSRSQYIGVSRIALEAYLAGKYFLPKELGGEGADPEQSGIEQAIRNYRERVEGTVRHGYANSFVETRTWIQLRQACETAINENVIVIVYGRPGVGKSRCLLEFAVRRMITAPVSILCSRNITTAFFAETLAQELGLHGGMKTAKLEVAIAEKLKRSPRPLFIDQANYLQEASLGTVCYVWEKARVPVVLLGTKDLHDLFYRSRLTQDVRAQLSSRVALHYLLSELTPGEAKAIIQRGLGEEATDEVVAQIYNVTGGIHRHVDMILPRILELRVRNQRKLSEGKVKMKDIVKTAGSRLMV